MHKPSWNNELENWFAILCAKTNIVECGWMSRQVLSGNLVVGSGDISSHTECGVQLWVQTTNTLWMSSTIFVKLASTWTSTFNTSTTIIIKRRYFQCWRQHFQPIKKLNPTNGLITKDKSFSIGFSQSSGRRLLVQLFLWIRFKCSMLRVEERDHPVCHQRSVSCMLVCQTILKTLFNDSTYLCCWCWHLSVQSEHITFFRSFHNSSTTWAGLFVILSLKAGVLCDSKEPIL